MPTEFVGRVAESAEVQRMVRRHRLVSLVGVGGCGKTRLAMEVAAASADHFPGGVWFVDLAVEQDGGEVGTRALSALGLPAATADLSNTVDALAQATADLATLVVLDNCEHVIDGAADFAAEVLDGVPQVTMLATSREALAVDGEQAWRVPNLSESAVELFVARAVASGADEAMLSDELALVEEICRQLDDVPLAIELAASHAGSLSLADVADHLDERFTLLDGGRRRGRTRQRQQTLKAMVDWSYDLLTPAQRQLLAELAVFSGSFSLAGVEAVATLPAPTIRTTLQTLVTQSLVTPPDRDGRYRLLETIRLYALDRLREADAVSATRDRHLAWVRRCIGAEAAIMTDPGDGSTTMAHELLAIAECDNGIAAMEWAEASGRQDDVFDVFTGLMPVWSNIPSRARAGLDWLDRIGEPPTSEPSRRAGWLMIAGQTRMNLGDLAGAMIDHLRGAQHVEDLINGPTNRFYTWAPVLRLNERGRRIRARRCESAQESGPWMAPGR